MKSPRERLDRLLVQRGIFPSREKAQAAILAGEVWVGGGRAQKPSLLVSPQDEIRISAKPRYVSRGGYKLEAALQHFGLSPQNWVCLDVGASTGGFTDCLLQHGARRVVAIDVGRGQLNVRLRADSRVEIHEGVNARYLQRESFPDPFDLATIDVSFISLRLVLPRIVPLVRPQGYLCVLIKPQFEAGPRQVPKGGVVRDPKVREEVIQSLRVWLAREDLPCQEKGIFPSPVLGSHGNQEIFWLLQRTPN